MSTHDLFDRAKQVGNQHIREWLAEGREDNGEWIAKNPTRVDNHAGSFKISLASGAWIDNATNDRGGDAVSLFAFLNLDACTIAASQKSYRNLEGGIQAEAARMILENHDPSYFPGSDDDFMPRKKSGGDNWAGFFPCKSKVEPLPRLDTSWYQKNWGKEIERWEFLQGDKTIMIVVRFVDGKTKSDRPFTLWSKAGKEYKWRSKAPEDRYPLWNLNELEERQGDAIILCEGQKAASRGKACAGLSEYIFTGWYGGAGNTRQTDWSSLRGRTVHFWPDSDGAGRKAIKDLREIATEYDINLSVVHPPAGVPKGWDLADAIEEGKDISEILEPVNSDDQPHYLDDMPLPFDIIGTSGSDIIFYPHGSNRIERYGASSLTKFKLMTLADRSVWGSYYAKDDGGIAWDSAINDIIRNSEKKPIFDWTRVRGAGAWVDGSDIVINTGEYLLINGEKKQLHERVGKYVYEKQSYVPYRKDDTLSTDMSKTLMDCLKTIQWRDEAMPYAVAGWLLLSAWGGVLPWRPHIWIVGSSGTGKSWIMDNIIYPISASEFGEKGGGTSTPAGVRQGLQNSAKCFMGDEMESDNRMQSERIEQILTLFRGSSSGQESGGATLHGSQDGEGKLWVMQSMACFSSIGSAMHHNADMNRFTVCELKQNRGDITEHKKNFSEIEQKAKNFNQEYSRAFHARTYNIIDELLSAVSIVKEQSSRILGTMRDGDQIGTLMAGAWMVEHDEAPTASEAYEWLKSIHIESLIGDSEAKSDEERCLDEIYSVKINVAVGGVRSNISVGASLEFWYNAESYGNPRNADSSGLTVDGVERELEQLGIKPASVKGQPYLYIAIAHPALRRAIRESGWADSYAALLGRLKNCEDIKAGPARFAGLQKRYVKLRQDKKVLQGDIPF